MTKKLTRLKKQLTKTLTLTCIGMVGCGGIIGCQKLSNLTHQKSAASAAAATAATSNPSNQHTQPTPTPVVYPIDDWQREPLTTKVNLQDVEAIKSLLGEPSAVDDKSLDYHSNIATKYSFAKVAQPYFNLLNSASYLELQWYFANAHDNATIKNISINHAKQAFQLTQHWFGNDGAGIIANMVQGQPIQNKTYQGIVVELARCENYHCSLVIKKPRAKSQSQQLIIKKTTR